MPRLHAWKVATSDTLVRLIGMNTLMPMGNHTCGGNFSQSFRKNKYICMYVDMLVGQKTYVYGLEYKQAYQKG